VLAKPIAAADDAAPQDVLRAVALGLSGSAFFSGTFIVNRAIGLAGGHWIWTAALRYAWVLAFLLPWFLARGTLGEVLREFRRHWRFWIVAGTIGYGIFYSGLAYASTQAPGWIVACTMQSTILATPVVLRLFGARVRLGGVALLAITFLGIVLVNLDRRGDATLVQAMGVLPVLVSAFAYPMGNQLVQEGRLGGRGWIPALTAPVTDDASARVLLLTLGSVPFWLCLLALPHPAVPSVQQIYGTAVVALCATVIGTSLFLRARQSVGSNPDAIAKVDATQAGYTVFSLAGEVVFLGAVLPGGLGWTGMAVVLLGLATYAVWSRH
jgi:drug/metabolite transporter (DMT)-like permease